MIETDILIVGAGCAGLSLAYHLVERGVDRSIVIVDSRVRFERDRTWCSFRSGKAHPFEDLANHRWARWRVRGQRWIERTAPGITYEHIPSDRFYDRCLAKLRGTVDLRLGVTAGCLREEPNRVVLETSAGPVRARIAFDSRPAGRGADGEIVLLQHFEGWHVRAERSVFDPGLATLMDFAVPQDHAIHFVYVLPYGPDEALVEATWFGGSVLDDAGYRRAIEMYLERELRIERWSVVRRERGVIPMSTAPHSVRASHRVYRIGLAGGMAKPSTGYAFRAIQRFSAAMAERLAREETPPPPEPRAWRARALDAIFLSYLNRYPERAPHTFERLFDRVEPALLVRFLSDEASAADCLRVMRTLPFAPFTLETARSARLWLRR